MNTESTSRAEDISITVRRDELAAILAGLRLYQRHAHDQVDSILSSIATDEGAFAAIDAVKVDELAERLNCEGQDIVGGQ